MSLGCWTSTLIMLSINGFRVDLRRERGPRYYEQVFTFSYCAAFTAVSALPGAAR